MNDNEQPPNPRENRILDAANELIVRYGYDKTTVQEIAQQAGVSKGSIYLHFKSKDELFEALLMREISRYSKDWVEKVEADPQGGTLGSFYRNFLIAYENNSLLKAMFAQDSRVLGSYMRQPGNVMEKMYGQSLRPEFIARLQDVGVVREDVEPQDVAHILDVIGYGLVSIGDIKDPAIIPPLDGVIELIAEMMDKTLAPSGGANSEAGKALVRQMTEEGLRAMDQLKESETDEDKTE